MHHGFAKLRVSVFPRMSNCTRKDDPERYVEPSFSKDDVYKVYQDEWQEMLNYMISTDIWKQQQPTK